MSDTTVLEFVKVNTSECLSNVILLHMNKENCDANELDVALDDNEWILSEDMVGQIKEIIYKRDLLNQVRQTDEVPNNIKF